MELLAPAGDMEKLKTACFYGADAVYMGGAFGLRARASNDDETLKKSISYAHKRGVKVYITVNIFAHNRHILELKEKNYFKRLAKLGADAFIISDLGVLKLARQEAPEIEAHISTQANVANYETAQVYADLGCSRIILAREISLKEIKEIRAKLSPKIKLEGFCHGAMCMAYSGRCFLSLHAEGRNANLGECSQPCRYNYKIYLEEEKRPGEFMPLETEQESGTEIFSADDLNMLAHLDAMKDAGLDCIKIEGRLKSAFYVGLTTKAYRMALDKQGSLADLEKLLNATSHRPFSTGFYFDKPIKSQKAGYEKTHDFIGVVEGCENGRVYVRQRGVFCEGETLVFNAPKEEFRVRVKNMANENGEPISRAPHAMSQISFDCEFGVDPLTMLSREI